LANVLHAAVILPKYSCPASAFPRPVPTLAKLGTTGDFKFEVENRTGSEWIKLNAAAQARLAEARRLLERLTRIGSTTSSTH
jgi:hypothetical protein